MKGDKWLGVKGVFYYHGLQINPTTYKWGVRKSEMG